MYISPFKSALREYRDLSEKWLDTLGHSLLPEQTGLDQSASQSGDFKLSSRKANAIRTKVDSAADRCADPACQCSCHTTSSTLSGDNSPNACQSNSEKPDPAEALRRAFVVLREMARDRDYAWKLSTMVDYRRMVISDGALVCALAALVTDIKPSLRKVVDIYKDSPRSDVYSRQIFNLTFKMSDKVRFTVNVINLCAAEDKDLWDRWLPVSVHKLKWDSARKKQAVAKKIQWLKFLILALGVATLIALVTVEGRLWEYFGSVAVLFWTIMIWAEGCEDARDWRAEVHISCATNIQKVRKNAVSKSVTAALALASELEAKRDDSWAPGREEYFQALMQEIDALEQLFQQWYLIPRTETLNEGH